MFRRQMPDRVNPRNVLPSRHTIFIRGLPGSTDVTKVKEYFSSETKSKCSVDFFSTSDDKKRLSVAIRFKSHELAKEILNKYNNDVLMGFPVELSWFKDFKKARAKVFEEQRQSGARQFQRSNFRGTFRSGDRRAMSPNGYTDVRRGRSSSSGGMQSGGMGHQQYSRSRSRSFTGSSSRSVSNSGRSASASPHLRRTPSQQPHDSHPGSVRGFSDKPSEDFTDKRRTRRQSYHSISGSSTSSRSPTRTRQLSATGRQLSAKPQQQQPMYQHNRGNASPINFSSTNRNKPISGSNPPDYTSFANAPAPDLDGGSSLVSGLIQLKRRPKPEQPSQKSRQRHASVNSSSSGISGASPRANVDESFRTNRRDPAKHMTSISPPYAGMSQLNYKSRDVISNEFSVPGDDMVELPKRKRQKRMDRSPGSPSPTNMPYGGRSTRMDFDDLPGDSRGPLIDQVPVHVNKPTPIKTGRTFTDDPVLDDIPPRRVVRSPVVSNDWRKPADNELAESEDWPRSAHRTGRSRKAPSVNRESPAQPENEAMNEGFRKRPQAKNEVQDDDVGVFKAPTQEVNQEEKIDDVFDLIRRHKESLAKDYKRDCEAFTAVVQTLISKDAELEARLMPMLKEILHERGQRCIEDLRSFIADHQPDSAEKNELVESVGT